LLIDAGLATPITVDAKPSPGDARPSLRRVWEGFLLLLGAKWLHTPWQPTPFSWRLAAATSTLPSI
jgi:hypothetical protein